MNSDASLLSRYPANRMVLFLGAILFVFSLGAQPIAAKQWQALEQDARQTLKQNPVDGDAQLLLGISLFHQDEIEASIPPLKQALRFGSTDEARTLYYLGLALSKSGEADAASESFLRLLTEHPGSPESERVRGISDRITLPAAERSGMELSGTVLSIDAGFDSNPNLFRDGDADALVSLYAYTDLSPKALPFLLGGSFFYEKFFDQSENDFVELAVNLNDETMLNARNLLDWSGELSQSFLDYESFEQGLSGTLGLMHFWNALWMGEARVFASATSADLEGYDGTELRFRLRAYRYLTNSGALQRIRFNADFQQQDRDSTWLSYGAMTLGVEGRFQLDWDVTVDLGLSWESREYDAESPFTGEVRDDDQLELSAYALRPIRDDHYLTAQAVYTNRDSSDNFYSADSLQLLVGLLWVK